MDNHTYIDQETPTEILLEQKVDTNQNEQNKIEHIDTPNIETFDVASLYSPPVIILDTKINAIYEDLTASEQQTQTQSDCTDKTLKRKLSPKTNRKKGIKTFNAKEYYDTHKEVWKKRIMCGVCGRDYAMHNKTHHMKSKRHLMMEEHKKKTPEVPQTNADVKSITETQPIMNTTDQIKSINTMIEMMTSLTQKVNQIANMHTTNYEIQCLQQRVDELKIKANSA